MFDIYMFCLQGSCFKDKLVPFRQFRFKFFIFLLCQFLNFLSQLNFLLPGMCLSCYHCQSKNESECIKQQTMTSCKTTQKACLTLSYQSVFDTPNGKIYDRIFRKKCVRGNMNCMWYCKSQLTMGDTNCFVSCTEYYHYLGFLPIIF